MPTSNQAARPDASIHVFFHEEGLAQKDAILPEINRLGASYENNNGTMYALDCPPETEVAPIIQYLERLESKDALHFRVNSWD